MIWAAGPPPAVRSLYLHIPFCERKCEYCDFASVAGRNHEAEYVTALRREIAVLSQRVGPQTLDTVFVGGGTSSYIEPQALAGVLDSVQRHFTIAAGAEVTLEANPSSTSQARARTWRAAGFNRVSLGVQSLEPDILGFLGRVHDANRAVAAVSEVRAAGFDSVNCDLIYAVPGLDDARWSRTLERVVGLAPDHVSCYELTVEPGTPLHTAVRRGRVQPVSAEPSLRQHWMAVDRLGAAGYDQYEVSNFARPGAECRHNLVYWRNGHYLAAGVGAHGHLPAALAGAVDAVPPDGAVSIRYWHRRGVPQFVDQMRTGALPVAGWEPVDAALAEDERLLVGLRLSEGVVEPATARAEVDRLVREGLLTRNGARIRATRQGQELLDHVLLRLSAAAAGNSTTTPLALPQTAG